MINTTYGYREMAASDNRIFEIKDVIKLADGTTHEITAKDLLAYTIEDATSSDGKFDIGAVIMKKYDITLDNSEGQFDGVDFRGASITSNVGLVLTEETTEWLRKGVFYITKSTFNDLTVNITAYDRMYALNKPFADVSVTFPATLKRIMTAICAQCNVTFDTTTIPESCNFTVAAAPASDTITCRDVLSYVAQAVGCFAKINRQEHIVFGWYPFGLLSSMTSDGALDTGDYHYFHNLMSQEIDTGDITITGVSVTTKTKQDNEITESYGEEGYVLEITDNPLIDKDNINDVTNYIGAKLRASTFRPLTISCQNDPCIEAGDAALVEDRRGNLYRTVITRSKYSFNGAQTLVSSAETPEEKTYTNFSAKTRLLDQAKRVKSADLSHYDMALDDMNRLSANSMGFYATTVQQDDGSFISYRHDKPLLEDSKYVYKSSIDGVFATTDYQGNDEATTAANKWSSAASIDGNMLLHMLTVNKLNADQIDVASIAASELFVQSKTDSIYELIEDSNFEKGLGTVDTDTTSYWRKFSSDTKRTVLARLGDKNVVELVGNDVIGGTKPTSYRYVILRKWIPVKKGDKLTLSFKLAYKDTANVETNEFQVRIRKLKANSIEETERYRFYPQDEGVPVYSEKGEFKKFVYEIDVDADCDMAIQFDYNNDATLYLSDVRLYMSIKNYVDSSLSVTADNINASVEKQIHETFDYVDDPDFSLGIGVKGQSGTSFWVTYSNATSYTKIVNISDSSGNRHPVATIQKSNNRTGRSIDLRDKFKIGRDNTKLQLTFKAGCYAAAGKARVYAKYNDDATITVKTLDVPLVSNYDGLQQFEVEIAGVPKGEMLLAINNMTDGADLLLTDVHVYGDVGTFSKAVLDITSEEIDAKVSKGDVVNQINISTEQIKISGNRLVIDSTNFKLDKTGNVKMEAGSINIGNGSFKVTTAGNVTMNKGSININDGNFKVTSSGSLTAQGASIEGTILSQDSNDYVKIADGIITGGTVSGSSRTRRGTINFTTGWTGGEIGLGILSQVVSIGGKLVIRRSSSSGDYYTTFTGTKRMALANSDNSLYIANMQFVNGILVG